MGSLRNPVGPLPSSIYWRRRAVGLSLLGLMVVLVLWVVLSGGGDGDKNGKGKGGPSPAASITPGPSGTGPVVPGEPGGREDPGQDGGADSAGNGGTGDGSTDGGADPGGADGSSAGASEGSDGGTGTGGAGGAAGTGGGAGQQLPANSPLPNCGPGAVELTIRAVENDIDVDQKPKFELIARNTSTAACKMDFGPDAATVRIKNSKDETVWSSKDCPKGARSLFLQVPPKSTVKHTLEWDRTRSDATKCDAPAGGSVEPGTYVVQLAGAKGDTSVFLKKD